MLISGKVSLQLLVLVNRLEGLSLPSTTIYWPARHDLVVDWAVKPQHKQITALPAWHMWIANQTTMIVSQDNIARFLNDVL